MSTAAIVEEATGEPVGSISFSGKHIAADGPVATSMVDAARRRRLSDAEIWEFFDGWSNGYLLVAQPEATTAAAGPDLTGAELAEFNRLHPRDRKGKFADHIGDAIASGIPAMLDQFSREQLRQYATKKRGLVLPRGASVEVIKDRLMASAGKQVAGAIAVEQGPLPDRASLLRMRVPELRGLAKTRGVKVSAKAKKADIVDALSPPSPVQAKPEIPEVRDLSIAAPHADRETALRHAMSQTPARVEPLSGGITAQSVDRVFLPDGTSYVRKVYKDYGGNGDSHSARSELLASKILEAVGVPAPAVVQIDGHTIAMEFVPGIQGGESGVLKAPAAVVRSDAGRRIGLADALMGNRDRAGGNWIRTPDGQIVPIDNDGAFLYGDRAAAGNPFTSYLMGRDEHSPWKKQTELLNVDLREVRSRIEALKPEFERLDAKRDYRQVLNRLDEIDSRQLPGTKRFAPPEALGQPEQVHGKPEIPEVATIPEPAARTPVLRRSSKPVIENRGEAIHAPPGSVAYHPDGQIGYAIQRMGDDKSIEVEGDALANVLGRTLTDSVTGRITPRQELDRLKEIVAQVPEGTRAREVLDDALRTLDAPRVPAPDIPASTPAPLRRLIDELADMPQMYNGTVRRQKSGSELDRAVELARRWGGGDLHRLELLQGVEGLFNQRHESEEGKFSIDRAVRKASADLNAMRAQLRAPEPNAPKAATSKPDTYPLMKIGELRALAKARGQKLRGTTRVGIINQLRAYDQQQGTVTAAGGLSGDALEEFNRLHPRGFGGRFGHKTGMPGGGRAAVLGGDFRGLTRVGGQLGFNRAALFEDESGQKWYVKAQSSVEHANNEALAAALYRKASVTVPEVHTGSGAPGLGDGPQTASEWIDLDTADKNDKIFRRDVHIDFGIHAWLANWDAAGAGGRDNIEVEKGTPFPVLVDAGGALLYRGAGGSKGDMFGDEVFEFDTLRDPRYNPTASKLFTDMTPEELAQAAERVEKITPKQIRDLVAEYDMPPSLAERLIARQKDLVRRGEQIRLDLEVQADPDRKSGRAALAAAGSRLSDRPAGQTYDPSAELTFAEDPGWSESKRQRVADILRYYRNSTFKQIGAYQRGQSNDDDLRIQDTDEEGNLIGKLRTEKVYEHMAYLYDAFDASPVQQPVLLYRGVQDGELVWGDAWRPDGDMVGVEWTELAPTSTSASESTARVFEGDALMRLHVPAGVGGIQLQGWPTDQTHTREAELLLQPGLRYRIVGDHSNEEQGFGMTFKKRVFDVVVEAVPDDEQ